MSFRWACNLQLILLKVWVLRGTETGSEWVSETETIQKIYNISLSHHTVSRIEILYIDISWELQIWSSPICSFEKQNPVFTVFSVWDLIVMTGLLWNRGPWSYISFWKCALNRQFSGAGLFVTSQNLENSCLASLNHCDHYNLEENNTPTSYDFRFLDRVDIYYAA